MLTRLFLDRNDKKIVAVAAQDVEPILDRNAALRAERRRGDWGRHVASIPNVILVQWANESGLRPFTREFNELVARKLDDPDWKHLRVDN